VAHHADDMSAERPPSGTCGGASTVVWDLRWRIDRRLGPAVAHRPSSGTGGGASTTVYGNRQTVVDAPTQHADDMSAERPPSGTGGGRSTTVDSRNNSNSRNRRQQEATAKTS
jgi:hypothetical protein